MYLRTFLMKVLCQVLGRLPSSLHFIKKENRHGLSLQVFTA